MIYRPPPGYSRDPRGFWQPTTTAADPGIPFLPLETALAPAQGGAWPNPQRARWQVPPASETNCLATLLSAAAAQPPFALTDWPNPLRAKQVPPDVAQGVAALLSAAAQRPFSLSDWPNPAAVRRLAAHLDANYALIASTLFAAPFAQADWPNPRGRAHPVDLRTFLDGLKLLLAGQDQFFGAAGQAPRYDWPNPLRPRQPTLAPDVNRLPSLLTVAAIPFALSDWPNPKGREHPAELRTFLNALELSLLGQDQFFGAAGQAPPRYDWQNPRVAVRPVLGVDVNLLPTLLTPAVFAPFSQASWPNPRGADYPLALRSHLLAVAQALMAQPFSQADWQNPRGAQFAQELRTYLQQSPQVTLLAVPFAQMQWPNPRGAAHPQALRTFLNSLEVQLLGQDQFFGAPGQPPSHLDWPNPRGAAYPTALRTFLDPLNLPLVSALLYLPGYGQVLRLDPTTRCLDLPDEWRLLLLTRDGRVLALPREWRLFADDDDNRTIH